MSLRILTSESVTEGHPDKLCDQISDAILDAHLAQDPGARVACEAATSGNRVWIFGEITSAAVVDETTVARQVLAAAGYDSADEGIDPRTAVITNNIRSQSPEIAAAVGTADDVGAGDQGIVYGYASDETEELLPFPIVAAHALTRAVAEARRSGAIAGLRPDGKAQVSATYGADGRPDRITAVVLSAQHDPGVNVEQLRAKLGELIAGILPAQLIGPWTAIHINPSGRFVLGGPAADAGLTGRKIIVDTYGGAAHHGGGAFSGKDPTKVDRSGAYAARHAAKNVVAAGLARRCEVQVAYGIGIAEPVAVSVDTFGTGITSDEAIARAVSKACDFRPGAIIRRLNLRRPIYYRTAAYGHFGKPELPWEQLDLALALVEAVER